MHTLLELHRRESVAFRVGVIHTPYTTLSPPTISAPRWTQGECRMKQGCVRWQWHPSHTMNNQWTPSGAYDRGAELQSFTPGPFTSSLSLFLSTSLLAPHTASHFFTIQYSHTYYQYTTTVSFHLTSPLSFFPSTSHCPFLTPLTVAGLLSLSHIGVEVFLILIQRSDSQLANKVTRCPLEDICFYDL